MTDLATLVCSIKGDVITRDHPEYASALGRWAKNAERNALVVVFVKDSEDVVESIKFATQNSLPIAIRGGGHNAAGCSSVEDGLVIDLSRHINQVRVDPDSKLAYVGGGCIWAQVDEAAIKHGLATVGGTINHTGVAGLTLGGGYGWLSARHGLTIDNLVQAIVVTADGSVLIANDTTNSDLFWAIRGGGSNFGVVTELVFLLHEQRRTVFGGLLAYPLPNLGQLVDVIREWSADLRDDAGLHLVLVKGPPGVLALVFVFYNGSEEDGKENFKKFYEVGPIINTATEMPYEKLNAMMNNAVDPGYCHYMTGFSHTGVPDIQTSSELFKKIEEVANEGLFIPGIIFEFVSLTKSNSVPISSTAFRRNLGLNALINIKWSGEHPEKTDAAREVAREMIAIVVKGQSKSGAPQQLGYTNYSHDGDVLNEKLVPSHPGLDASPEGRSAIAFGTNYARLQVIKGKYDPNNIFNRWYAITPLAETSTPSGSGA